jgi:hypothetical protein
MRTAVAPDAPAPAAERSSVTVSGLILCIVAATALFGAMTRHGLGVTPDSGHYLAAADHVVFGDGFTRLGGEPMASWPPLYPATLAVFRLMGVEPLEGARWLNLALLAATASICFLWASARLRAPAAIVAATAAATLGPPITFIAGLALTDLMFVPFQVAALFACDMWLARPTRARLACCAGAVTLACLTRYPAVVLMWTVMAVMVWRGSGPLAARVRAASVVACAAGLPLGAWLIRNFQLTGTLSGPRYASDTTLGEAAVAAGQGVMTWLLPWRVLLLGEGMGVAALLLMLAALAAFSYRQRNAASSTVVLCLVFVAFYLVSLISSVATMQLDLIGDRMLAPVWVPLVFATAVVVAHLRHARFAERSALPSVVRVMCGVVVAGAVMVAAARTASTVVESWRDGPGGASYSNFNTAQWRSSPTIAWARQHIPASALTFATSPAAAYVVGQIDARPMPRKHARRSPAVRVDDLALVQHEVAQAGGAYLLFFNEHVPSNAYDLADLLPFFRLEDVAVFTDGRVIRLIAHSNSECQATDDELVLAMCDRSTS